MSYDLYLEVDVGGPEPLQLDEFHWNYTSNCSRMWRAAGANLAEFHGKRAEDCAPVLEAAIAELRADPEKYEAMNPENGWGSYATLLPRLDYLLAWFQKAPLACVRVWA